MNLWDELKLSFAVTTLVFGAGLMLLMGVWAVTLLYERYGNYGLAAGAFLFLWGLFYGAARIGNRWLS